MCAVVCIAAQAFTTQSLQLLFFILGFVIYRSRKKLNTTAQSHRNWVSDHPFQLILTRIQQGKKNQ